MALTGSSSDSQIPSGTDDDIAFLNVKMVVKPPQKDGSHAMLKDEAWNKHLPLFRRLYVDEGKTLKQVMDIMESKHNFKASYDILKDKSSALDAISTNTLTAVLRPKMYKQRFRRWGFRKNIRLQEAEDEMDFYELTNARELRQDTAEPSSAVQLASGQVVDLDRLVAHLRRKMLYRRQTQKTITPTYVTPPEELYVCEAVLDNTWAYLVSKMKGGPTSEGQRLTCSGPPQFREATIKKPSSSQKKLTNCASPSPPR